MIDDIQRLKEEFIFNATQYMRFGAAESEDDPEYDPGFDAGYTQDEVDACESILDAFIAQIAKVAKVGKEERQKRIMDIVQTAVLALNEVNEGCDGALIETDQREQICEIIISAAEGAGLEPSKHDITEEWREW